MANTYKMIFTWEREWWPDDTYGGPLSYYSDNPEEGEYEGEAEFTTLSEYEKICDEWEGHLYQLFKNGEPDRI